MKLIDKITNDTIIFPLKSEDEPTTIQELLNKLLEERILTETTKLFSFIKNHDKIMNPAVGRGIAFHHSSSIEVDDMTAILGVSIGGIDYKSPDRQKVHFILLLLDPTNDPNLHRKFIHRFQKFINDLNIKIKLLDCKSKKEIFYIINEWEEQYLLNENI
jgi:mannitol/fructose-specific phosphotransferase system IIA component (Ntr-type)